MRTQEQISNLRRVFRTIYGPFVVMFWTDEQIDLLAERIQTEANNNSEWTWEIRVHTEDNFEEPWDSMNPEPKQPCCNVYTIKKKCKELLQKYPAIVAILVVAKENSKLIFQFNNS